MVELRKTKGSQEQEFIFYPIKFIAPFQYKKVWIVSNELFTLSMIWCRIYLNKSNYWKPSTCWRLALSCLREGGEAYVALAPVVWWSLSYSGQINVAPESIARSCISRLYSGEPYVTPRLVVGDHCSIEENHMWLLSQWLQITILYSIVFLKLVVNQLNN